MSTFLRVGGSERFGMSGVNALLSSRLIVAMSVVVAVAGLGVPRLVSMLVRVISIMPSIAAIAAGESDGCHHH
jgi:hypothetical protein